MGCCYLFHPIVGSFIDSRRIPIRFIIHILVFMTLSCMVIESSEGGGITSLMASFTSLIHFASKLASLLPSRWVSKTPQSRFW